MAADDWGGDSCWSLLSLEFSVVCTIRRQFKHGFIEIWFCLCSIQMTIMRKGPNVSDTNKVLITNFENQCQLLFGSCLYRIGANV